jgi:disulfide bond formation protein DsbB
MAIDAGIKPQPPTSARPSLMAAAGIGAIALLTIAGAWFFQLVLNIQPCELCLEQRYAYYVTIPLAVLVALSARQRAARGLVLGGLALLALITLANAGLGVYHAGVEWGWWQGPTACSGALTNLGAANLLDGLNRVKIVRCDEVQWRFLGLSLAGYNVLISLGMAIVAGWGIGASSRTS